MVLGADVGLEETCIITMCGLVGRLYYSYLADKLVSDWVLQNWVPILGYASEILYLTKGWMGFIYKTPEDVTLLLNRFWVMGRSSLMLKRWRVAFDQLTEHFQHNHLWVLLPGLPLHFWNEGALKDVGNALGQFISLDNSILLDSSRKVGKILVEIDIHEGLPKVLDIECRGRHIKHRLDYQGIPFRCSWCHCTCHLLRDCSGKVSEEKSEETLLQEDPPDYMMEVDSMGEIPFHSLSKTWSPSVTLNSLSNKLNFFCPSLFSSLNLWEKEALDTSGWFLCATTVDKGAMEGGLDHTSPVRDSLAHNQNVSKPPELSPEMFNVSRSTFSPRLHTSIPLPPINHLVSSREPNSSPSPTQPKYIEATIEVGFRELEEDANNLSLALDSLIPFIRDNKDATILPTYLGKRILESAGTSEATSSKTKPTREGKNFAWSRGVRLKVSPMKTRSCRKKTITIFRFDYKEYSFLQ
jgi:hypothetical protein